MWRTTLSAVHANALPQPQLISISQANGQLYQAASCKFSYGAKKAEMVWCLPPALSG